MPLPHELCSTSIIECGASMNLEGSIRICGSSLPTNWHHTLSAKYSTLKLSPLRSRVIPDAMKAIGSESLVARKGWAAYRAQFTYNGTRLEEVWTTKTLKLTSSEVNLVRCTLTRRKSLRTRSMPRVMRPYLTIHRYRKKKKHKPQVRYKMIVFQDSTICKTMSYKWKCIKWKEN